MKYVYLINLEGTDVFKIGHSKNPKQRIKSLQTGNPYKLVLVESFKSKRASQIEKTLHRRFASSKTDVDECKLQGEFFNLSNKDIADFQKTCQRIDSNFDILEKYSTLI